VAKRLNFEPGQRFGHLAVVEFAHMDEAKHASVWRVRCDCGTERLVLGFNLSRLSGCGRRCAATRPARAAMCGAKSRAYWGSLTPEARRAVIARAVSASIAKMAAASPEERAAHMAVAHRALAKMWEENPPPRACDDNPNVRATRPNAEYIRRHASRMTTKELARATGEPRCRVSAVARRKTWLELDAEPLPPLPFPDEIDGGDPVRPVPDYDGAYAVTPRGGEVYSFPLSADGQHRAYGAPRLLKFRRDGKVKLSRAGRKTLHWPRALAAEAWGLIPPV
jgi:hypothetical protein